MADDAPPAYSSKSESRIVYPTPTLSTSLATLTPAMMEELKRQLVEDMKKEEERRKEMFALWAKPEMRLEYIFGKAAPWTGTCINFQNSAEELNIVKPKKTNYDAPLLRFYPLYLNDNRIYSTTISTIEPIYSLDCNDKIPCDSSAIGVIVSAVCDVFGHLIRKELLRDGIISRIFYGEIRQKDTYWEFSIYGDSDIPPNNEKTMFIRFNENNEYIHYTNIKIYIGDSKTSDLMYVSYNVKTYRYKKGEGYDKGKDYYHCFGTKTVIEPFTTHNELLAILSKWKPELAPHVLI